MKIYRPHLTHSCSLIPHHYHKELKTVLTVKLKANPTVNVEDIVNRIYPQSSQFSSSNWLKNQKKVLLILKTIFKERKR